MNKSSLVLKCQKIKALLTCAARATSDMEVSWKPRLANNWIAALRISSRESCDLASEELPRESSVLISSANNSTSVTTAPPWQPAEQPQQQRLPRPGQR